VLRQKLLTSVRHPSQKALVHDIVARHFGKPVWHMTLESRTPVLMVDGSAAVRAFAEANRGANPNNPTALAPVIGYQPSPIEPGPSGILVPMGTLWTRMDIRGRDFGGLDVYP
jgi:hypothetical protein